MHSRELGHLTLTSYSVYSAGLTFGGGPRCLQVSVVRRGGAEQPNLVPDLEQLLHSEWVFARLNPLG